MSGHHVVWRGRDVPTPEMIAAVRERQAQIADLRAAIKELKAELAAMPTPSSPASVPPGHEVNAHPGPPADGDHEAGPGCASHVP